MKQQDSLNSLTLVEEEKEVTVHSRGDIVKFGQKMAHSGRENESFPDTRVRLNKAMKMKTSQ